MLLEVVVERAGGAWTTCWWSVLELLQSLAASSPTVLAPWLRFCDRVVLIVEGRLVTALVSAADALLACAALVGVDRRGDRVQLAGQAAVLIG